MNSMSLSQSQFSSLLGRLPLFSNLVEVTLKNLAAGTRQVQVARNETVFAKGDRADYLHMVVGGQIKMFLSLANGVEKMMGTVGHGEAFDLAAALLGEPHPANAVARQDSHLLLIDRATVLRELQRDGNLALRLLNETARHKLSLMRDLKSCIPRTSIQRVACFLLQFRPGQNTEYEIHLPTTKRELADKLNLTQETLSRVLHQLMDRSVLAVHGRLIRVLDCELLSRINLEGQQAMSAHA